MSDAIDRLMKDTGARRMTRRDLLVTLSAVAMAPRVIAQGSPTPIKLRSLNSATMAVSDVQRSVAFYQKIFGMPVQTRQGQTAILRIGDGPQYLALTPANGGQTGIIGFGMTVYDFNVDKLKGTLTEFGVKDVRVNMRGPELGGGGAGAPQGTPELFFIDANGFEIQLQAPTYGGGGGMNGDVFRPIAKPSGRPPIPLVAYSHMTFGGDRAFYERAFSMPTQAMQGAIVMMRVGPGPAFITGGVPAPRPAAGQRPTIGHLCVTMHDFDPNKVTGILIDNGLEPIEYGGQANTIKPMTVRTRLRQKAGNGGGPTHPLGSYELYLRDPDNIEVQIQDVSYCGGSGANGQICP